MYQLYYERCLILLGNWVETSFNADPEFLVNELVPSLTFHII